MRRITGYLFVPLILCLCALSASWWLADRTIAPRPARVEPPPEFLSVQTIRIPSASGSLLSAWYSPVDGAAAGTLLMHGNGGNRRSMLGRARLMRQLGYSVLLIDLQAHGESPGEHMGLGLLEAKDAEAALAWLRRRLPERPLGVIGYSLGGAASLLGQAASKADALVLEGVYSDIEQAVANRLVMRLGPLGRHLTPLLTWQIRPRLGVAAARISPLSRIAELDTPVLLIGGEKDRRSTGAETRALYHAARGPKALWMVPDAAHQDFQRLAPEQYARRVGDFLRRHLERG